MMPLRTKLQIAITLLATAGATVFAASLGSRGWLSFWLLLLAVLLGSGFKVGLPRGGDGTMSLNFPFILLGVIELSPLQAMLLAALSVAAQCRVRVDKLFTVVQIGFNVANAMLSTACAVLIFYALQHLAFSTAPALALSSLAYFLCNTVALAFVLGSFKDEHPLLLWRKEFPWYLPFYLVGAVLAATVHWMSRRFGWGTALLLIPVVYTLYRAYVGQVTQIQERQQHLEETEALQLRTIEGLAMAIEAKDQNTHDHLFRVRHYVKALGQELKLSTLEMQALETAAFLHDIGKLAVPESIINKPGRLTPEEFEKMKIHPVVGADILERVRFPYPVVPVVRSHHEWWNGTGYPDGLQGEAIPIGARILTVVDCFDALVSDRPYRKGLTSEKALTMIRDLSGKQFDPSIVKVFEKCHADAEAELEALVPVEFTPLNMSVDVSRGPAPGAGFEAESDSVSKRLEHLVVSGQQPEDTPATLSLQGRGDDEVVLTFTDRRFLPEDLALTITALMSDLRQQIPFDACAAYLLQPEHLGLLFSQGPYGHAFPCETVQLAAGISGWVAENCKPIFNGNAGVEPGCPLLADGASALNSALSIPLTGNQDKLLGVLTLYAKQADAFRRNQMALLLDTGFSLYTLLKSVLQQQSSMLEEPSTPKVIVKAAGHFFATFEQEVTKALYQKQSCMLAFCILNVLGTDRYEGKATLDGTRLQHALSSSFDQPGFGSELVTLVEGNKILVLRPTAAEGPADEWRRSVQLALDNALGLLKNASLRPVAVGFASCPEDGNTVETLMAKAAKRCSSSEHQSAVLRLNQTSSLVQVS